VDAAQLGGLQFLSRKLAESSGFDFADPLQNFTPRTPAVINLAHTRRFDFWR
jgi:hypothetical protein